MVGVTGDRRVFILDLRRYLSVSYGSLTVWHRLVPRNVVLLSPVRPRGEFMWDNSIICA